MWAGVGIGDRQARFWGVPFGFGGRLKCKMIDFISNRIRLSAFSFDEESLRNYYIKLMTFKPAYLYGYVSFIETFARFVESNGLPLPFKLKCVIVTSEVLTEITRKYLEEVFNCRVFNEYGCGEVGSIAHECEVGNLHIMSENLIIEILAGGEHALDSEVGEIVITELNNYVMPLIRYRLSDFGEYTMNSCNCGRGLPIIRRIIGRAYDIIRGPDGRLFHGEFFLYIFEEVKKLNLGVRQFQVIQTGSCELRIRIVPDRNFSDETKRYILGYLVNRMGTKINVQFEIVDTIPREPSGKIRLVKAFEKAAFEK